MGPGKEIKYETTQMGPGNNEIFPIRTGPSIHFFTHLFNDPIRLQGLPVNPNININKINNNKIKIIIKINNNKNNYKKIIKLVEYLKPKN